VVDAHNVLLDDRSLVELRGDEVRGRADQLHAAVERLVVGPGALEAGQERVVDVDRPALQPRAGLVGEHLHVAGEHDQVDVQLLDECEQPLLGVGPAVGGDRDVVERHPVGGRERLQVGVVGHDRRDLDLQRADAPPVEQLVQAVLGARDHDQGAVRRPRVPQAPPHVVRLRDPGEVLPQRLQRDPGPVGLEVHPHEEPDVLAVVELLALQDVARLLHQEAGDGVDDAGTVGAVDRQHELRVLLRHRPSCGRQRTHRS
jgi:hypothetical protein